MNTNMVEDATEILGKKNFIISLSCKLLHHRTHSYASKTYMWKGLLDDPKYGKLWVFEPQHLCGIPRY